MKTKYKHIFISTIFTMKNNNLFRKFLALFLTGTMLAGVGCKDYDDDIDDINKKIDDLNAKVELKADASALQTISDKLKDVDFSKFVTDAELSQELAYRCDMERSNLSRIEAGRTNLTVKTICSICNALSVNMRDVIR